MPMQATDLLLGGLAVGLPALVLLYLLAQRGSRGAAQLALLAERLTASEQARQQLRWLKVFRSMNGRASA